MFSTNRVQDTGMIEAVTNPIDAPPIEFFVPSIVVEGGGEIHATYVIINSENVTVDAGGHINCDGEGYNYTHTESSHGSSNIFSGALAATGHKKCSCSKFL